MSYPLLPRRDSSPDEIFRFLSWKALFPVKSTRKNTRYAAKNQPLLPVNSNPVRSIWQRRFFRFLSWQHPLDQESDVYIQYSVWQSSFHNPLPNVRFYSQRNGSPLDSSPSFRFSVRYRIFPQTGAASVFQNPPAGLQAQNAGGDCPSTPDGISMPGQAFDLRASRIQYTSRSLFFRRLWSAPLHFPAAPQNGQKAAG